MLRLRGIDPVCHVAFGSGSALYLYGELEDTRGLRLSDLPEGGRVHVENGRNEVGMVRNIEGFSPELHFCLVAERKALVK